jgi:hypothetical protein
MNPIKKMTNIKEEIKDLLSNHEHYRDDDNKLIAAFYFRNYGGKSVFENKSSLDFLKEFAEGKYVTPDNITRVRRKLQEQYVLLRGKKYNKRHELEGETKIEIHNL